MGLLDKIKNILSNEKVKKYEEFVNNANKYFESGDYKKAIEYYLEALKIKDDDADVWYRLALSYYNLEDYDSALDAIDNALKLMRNHEFMYLKGLIHYKKNEMAKAYEYLANASEKIKKSDLYMMLGEIAIKNKKYDAALAYYLKAYKLNENNITALFNSAKIYLLFGDVENAYNLFKKILEKEELYKSCVKKHKSKLINKLVETSNTTTVKEEYFIIPKLIEEVINSITNGYEDYLFSGLRLLERKDYIKSLKYFNKILQIDEKNDVAHYYKSVISELFEEYSKGVYSIEFAISEFGRCIYYAKKGDLLSKIKNPDAVEFYKKSLEICPNPYAYFGLAIHYYREGNYNLSQNFFDRILELYLENIPEIDAHLFTIYALIGKGDITGSSKYYEQAVSYVDRLLERDSEDSKWWKIAGYIYYKLGKYNNAYECFMNAFRLNSHDVETIKSLIVVNEIMNNYDEAFSMATKLAKISKEEEINEILKKLRNREPTNLEIDSPLLNTPIIYYKFDIIGYYLANIYKFLHKNPIGAYIYLEYIESSEILTTIDEEKRNSLKIIIEKLKKVLPKEMYRFCESPSNYKPNKAIIESCKNEFLTFGYII
ncbi:MAG: tetratricopeptide repeat protein [Methanococci archaeon]|nr:tetratricopeptide repeat protein [Methanococci archaeon]